MRIALWRKRQRSIRRQRRTAKLRVRRAGLGQLYGEVTRLARVAEQARSGVARERKPERIPIVLHGSLCITSNAEHALLGLAQLEHERVVALLEPHRGANVEVYIDLQEVIEIDAPALLVLTSRVDALRDARIRVNGNFPRHPAARSALEDANFVRWLSGKAHRPPKQSSGRLELYAATRTKDHLVRPHIARRIRSFLAGKLECALEEETDMLGLAVAEALENVWKHAYIEAPLDHGWQAVGLYRNGTRSVAVIDMGMGIAETARKGRGWKIGLGPIERLELASLGLLTASGHPKHGKGLSSLVEFCRSQSGRRLHVLSSGGAIVWSDRASPTRYLIPLSIGTIVCLEIDDVG